MEAVVARTQFLAQDNHYPLALSQSNDLGICFPFVMNPNSWGYIFFIDRV